MSFAIFFTFSGKIEKKDEMSAFNYIIISLKKTILPFCLIFLLFYYVAIYLMSIYYFNEFQQEKYMSHINNSIISFFSNPYMYLYIIPIMLIAPFTRFILYRYITPRMSATYRRWRVKQTNAGLSDIRNEIVTLKAKDYDPRPYFKDGFFFIGKDEKEQPIYITDEDFAKNHIKIPGASQKGKGVELGVLIAQCIIKGYGTWFNDIKPDDFIYPIIVQTCKDYNLPMPIVVDLTGEFEGLGYSPFTNGSDIDRKQRIVKALRLKDTGKTADYYLSLNRAVLYKVFDLWDGTILHLKKLLHGDHPSFSPETKMYIKDNSVNLRTRLEEWAQYKSILVSGKNAFNVKDALLNNRVVYVRGSMTDPIIRAINIALYDELIQVALKEKLPKHTFVAWDEARFIITDLLADSLATLLSKHVSMAITFQARNDTKNLIDPMLNVDSIQNSIEVNTQFTLSYGAQDDESAKWIAEQTGEIIITTTKLESVETNDFGAEHWKGKRMVGTEKQWLIPENKIKALPARVGVFIRPNHLAQLFYSCWVPLTHPIAQLTPIKKYNIYKNKQPKQPEPIKQPDLLKQEEPSEIELEKARELARQKMEAIKNSNSNKSKQLSSKNKEQKDKQETSDSIIVTLDNIDQI